MAPRAVVSQHPGSSEEEIKNEPDWGFGGNHHRIGVKNRDDRVPGLTHEGDADEEQREGELVRESQQAITDLRTRVQRGELVNFRDIMQAKTDFHLKDSKSFSVGGRFVVDVTEDWVKAEQEWPANEKAHAKQQQQNQQNQGNQDQQQQLSGEEDHRIQADESKSPADGSQSNQSSADTAKQQSKSAMSGQSGTQAYWKATSQSTGSIRFNDDEEDQWRRNQDGQSKHHGAYATRSQQDEGYQSGESCGESSEDEGKEKYRKLREKYNPQEISLLRLLQHEKDNIKNLGQDDGKGLSPLASAKGLIEIDVQDQFGPDNWIPRSGDLIRNTGKHPMNAEPQMSKLFDAGLITPNELHYVRCHGAVPRLYWETHELDVENGTLVLSMDDLEQRFDSVNIPIALACDGNRRGELNLIRKSKGFSWGAGAVSCAYWKGALLRDILLAAGVEFNFSPRQKRYVNFEGAEDLSDGKYATSIPLEYALDPANDVLIAYEMNNVKLPPDHGFPCRLIIPGFVGGRAVKWLARIWTSEKENDSHYHIWDNRVLPSFITEKDGEFADTMFRHPSTACMEQNLNSAIVKPAEGETITFEEGSKKETYRVEGYAYDGGGHEVQKVELSLDEGETWLYCLRRFAERPIRHGNKFWAWVHWYIDVDMAHFLEARSLTVRCFNVFKNTQPQHGSWNTMGMMNNGWYIVKPVATTFHKGSFGLVYKHPVDPKGQGGWMKPSTEVQLQAAKQETGVPDKRFTREEVEKHSSADDAWIVVNNKVFDATSVLDWHPGGAASILSYAGRLTAETTSSFESIHDDYATKKLNECVIGNLTDKSIRYIEESAKAAAQAAAKAASSEGKVYLKKQRWLPVKLSNRKSLSKDTRAYTFSLPGDAPQYLGLGTCQHIQFGIHTKDKMLIRSYTPTRPILSSEEDGTFELVVKTYLPNSDQPGGAFSNFLDCMPIGEDVQVRGPTGEIEYKGNGKFVIEGNERAFSKISLIVGGSGLTPAFQLLERVLRTEDDKTQIRVVDANKTEGDILLKDELDKLSKRHSQQCEITHVLSHPSADWQGLKGHINENIIKQHCFPPERESVVFLCGPPAMIQKAALPALKDWGYEEEKNCYGF